MTPEKRDLPFALTMGLLGLIVGIFVAPSRLRERIVVQQLHAAEEQAQSLKRRANVSDRPVTVSAVSKTRIEAALEEEIESFQRQSEAGEYTLRFEDPIWRQDVEAGMKEHIAQTSATSSLELLQLLAETGVPSADAEKLQKHRDKIAFASLYAEEILSEVHQGKRRFDDFVRSQMTPQNYARYRQYEESVPARREFDRLSAFAEAHSLSVPVEHRDGVVGFIQQVRGYTELIDRGPYSDPPQALIDPEKVVAALKQHRDRLGAIIERAQLTLPTEIIPVFQSYYSDRAKQLDEDIETGKTLSARLKTRLDQIQ
jgi:hypothetical protein